MQPAAISITNATEYGLVYRPAEVADLGKLARERELAFHMDGARFANALATTGERPADVTWRAGIDAMSFGFVKNGGLNAEALILFDTDLFDEVAVRRKRAGHLSSKGRMFAAQILALLEDRSVAGQCAPRQRDSAIAGASRAGTSGLSGRSQ